MQSMNADEIKDSAEMKEERRERRQIETWRAAHTSRAQLLAPYSTYPRGHRAC